MSTTTPLFQEALIEARKLREAATAEAKAAVLEAVAPVIKQMIDKEISGIILEQEEPLPAEELPPPAPPAPSPDAGATGPISPTPTSAEIAPPPPMSGTGMPSMPPAVSAASPPIASPGSPVLGKIDVGPAGEQQIVIPVDALFQKETNPAMTATSEVPPTGMDATPPAADPMAAATEGMPPPATPPVPGMDTAVPPPSPEEELPAPSPLAEIHKVVAKFIKEQAAKPPIAANAEDVTAPGEQAPMMSEAYEALKGMLEAKEEEILALRKPGNSPLSEGAMKAQEKELFRLYEGLESLNKAKLISNSTFRLEEHRIGLLRENLAVINSYLAIPLVKGTKTMSKATQNTSVKALLRQLFEGAEGFEHNVGKVSPAGESEGGSDEHAKKSSGNTAGVKAEAEKAPFPTKEKKDWPGKPSGESLLEQLEEEVAAMMAEMGYDGEEGEGEEVISDGDDMMLEISDEEVVAEAKKIRARLKALKEQAELAAAGEEVEVPGGEEAEVSMDDSEGDIADHLSLTIDLDGVDGGSVENVNVSVDGQPMDSTDAEEGAEGGLDDIDLDMGGEEGSEHGEGEEPESDEMLAESAKGKKNGKATPKAVSALQENKILRGQLAETQVLTARSLYVNKLFVRDNLSGAQKRKIVEYLDKAQTIQEAKEVYNRISRVLDKAKGTTTLSESAERGSRMLGAQAAEPSFDTSRWQLLAGVKKSTK